MIDRAAKLNMPAIAITDHGTMFGVIDFYRAAREAGIKPIIGCEVYMALRSRLQKEARRDDSQYHLVLLAENETGYRNLMHLVSSAYTEGFYYKPRIDRELLEKHHEGLIALSACLAGEIPTLILEGQIEKAYDTARYFRDLFGDNNFYLELHDHGLKEQKVVNKVLAEISRDEGIPLVASNDVHYLERDDAGVHDVLLCIQTGKTIEETERMRFDSQEFYLKSEAEMADLFSQYPEAISNTLQIAERCNLEYDFSQRHLPEYSLPEGVKAPDYLKELCYKGYTGTGRTP
jgi:DNA polymerase-3 subunit alpha